MKFETFQENIEKWAEEKGILDTSSNGQWAQFSKFKEEVAEFIRAFNEYHYYPTKENLSHAQDEFGDVMVTAVMVAFTTEIDIEEALDNVWAKISKRKGKTINGIFVKEEDL